MKRRTFDWTRRFYVAYDIGANGNADISEVVKPDYLVKEGALKYAINFLGN